jgi:pimeloyl-ACP methyl ester carboxylesterase
VSGWLDRLYLGESKRLNAAVRATIPGAYIELSDGATRYELGGPESGPPVVLVHGFLGPYFIWDATFAGLTAAGFRVLRYDLFGRGYSDRPQRPYGTALFVRQLAELLDALGIPKAHLVSLSMGGVVAAEFASHHPQRVNKLAFIDPAGFELGLSLTARALKLPLVGEFILGVLGLLGNQKLIQAMVDDFFKKDKVLIENFVPQYEAQMQYRGFKRALLSSFREGMLDDQHEIYGAVGASGKPVLLIWGEEDETVPYLHHELFQRLAPQTEFHAIPDTAHIPHVERPELVNPILIRFLRS